MTAPDTNKPAERYSYSGNRLPMTAFEDITLTEIAQLGMYQYALFEKKCFHHRVYGSTTACLSHGPFNGGKRFSTPQLRDPSTDFYET